MGNPVPSFRERYLRLAFGGERSTAEDLGFSKVMQPVERDSERVMRRRAAVRR